MLKALANEMDALGIPYDFMVWSGAIVPTYWVGEYIDVPIISEDGREECSIILTGTSRESFDILEKQKNIIKNHFGSINGLRKTVEDGQVVFFYDSALPIHTDQADLYRIQVTLTTKKWRNTY